MSNLSLSVGEEGEEGELSALNTSVTHIDSGGGDTGALDDLLPAGFDFPIYGNMTANKVIKAVVSKLDGGPDGIGPEAASVLAVSTPIILIICVAFMSKCRRVYCCRGCVCYWFNCTGACRHGCGGEKLLSGTEPETGLQPDEEVTDPDHILGDEDHEPVLRDPQLAPAGAEGVPAPPSTASEMSDDERAGEIESSYSKDCRQCCDTVAACLENGDGVEMNGNGCMGPAIQAAHKSKNGNGKKK